MNLVGIIYCSIIIYRRCDAFRYYKFMLLKVKRSLGRKVAAVATLLTFKYAGFFTMLTFTVKASDS